MGVITLSSTLAVAPTHLRRSSPVSRPAVPLLHKAVSRRPSPSLYIARKHGMRINAILMDNDPRPEASLVREDASTGIQFPIVQELGGHSQRCLGIGQRKKAGFPFPVPFHLFSSNQYAVAMYVEPQIASKEFSYRERGGLELSSEGDLCDAVLDGAFVKSMHVIFAHQVMGDEFAEDIYNVLAPRMKLTGCHVALKDFTRMFYKKNFTQGNEVQIVWQTNGDLEVAIHQSLEESTLRTFHSDALSRAVFEAFIGGCSLSETTKASVAKGAKGLLESDKTRREYNKRSIIEEKRYDRE